MTKLDAIRKRWAEATPGPWRLVDFDGLTLVAPDGTVVNSDMQHTRRDADLDAIAHAPTDIAALLEVVEAAREADRAIATAVERDGLSVIPPSIQEELMHVHLALAKLTAEVEE